MYVVLHRSGKRSDERENFGLHYIQFSDKIVDWKPAQVCGQTKLIV